MSFWLQRTNIIYIYSNLIKAVVSVTIKMASRRFTETWTLTTDQKTSVCSSGTSLSFIIGLFQPFYQYLSHVLLQSLVSLWCSFQHLWITVHHHVKVLRCMALFISPNMNTASACCLYCVEGRVFQRRIPEGRWPSTAALLLFWQLWEKHLFAFKLVLASANPTKSLNPTNSRSSR